jgi:hypothetical protein
MILLGFPLQLFCVMQDICNFLKFATINDENYLDNK